MWMCKIKLTRKMRIDVCRQKWCSDFSRVVDTELMKKLKMDKVFLKGKPK